MDHVVTEVAASERPTAVIAEATTWEAFPTLWGTLLDQVWAAVRSTDQIAPGRNVMLYKDDVPNVEVGVEVAEPFLDMGRVVSSTLPTGRAAMTLHHGSYANLGAAHHAVIDWCDRHGLQRIGPRWEIYGHWIEDSADQDVEIYYLVQ
jgi:effector-binding domain-containing protein